MSYKKLKQEVEKELAGYDPANDNHNIVIAPKFADLLERCLFELEEQARLVEELKIEAYGIMNWAIEKYTI
jgi:hypothetical protein